MEAESGLQIALRWFVRKARLVLMLIAVFLGVGVGHLASSGAGAGWVAAAVAGSLAVLGLGWALVGFWTGVFEKAGRKDG
jgi:hypothetical protein